MPVKNRLEELQMKSKHVKKADLEANGKKEEAVPLQTGDMSKGCADFFENIQDIIENIDKVRSNVTEVRKLHKQLLYDLKNPNDESLLSDLVAENQRLGTKIRSKLKMEQDQLDDIALKKNRENQENSTKKKRDFKEEHELRMRRTQISAQSRRFLDIWTEYNNEQVEYKVKSKELFKRRVKVKVGDDIDDDKIEEMLEMGDTKIFGESILEQTRIAKQQLTELQDRHDQILKLEQSVREVFELFQELSALVSQQGEAIDSIAHNVEAAEMKVEGGKDHLQKAEQHQKSARKKKMILAAILGVVILILVLVILSEFDAFSSSSAPYIPPPTTTTAASPVERIVEEPIPSSSSVTEESIPS